MTWVKRGKGWKMSCDVGKAREGLILQPFFRFSYITGFSLMSPGEPPMVSRLWNVLDVDLFSQCTVCV